MTCSCALRQDVADRERRQPGFRRLTAAEASDVITVELLAEQLELAFADVNISAADCAAWLARQEA